MPSVKLLLLSATVALAGVVPRAYVPDGYCCFSLSDTTTGKTIQQDSHTGILYFDGDQPNGRYCMNSSDTRDVLWDSAWNACIISWGTEGFECLDPTRGLNLWTLGHDGGELLLSHDGSSDYKACPNKSGKGEIVYSDSIEAAGCRDIHLAAQGLEGACQAYAQ